MLDGLCTPKSAQLGQSGGNVGPNLGLGALLARFGTLLKPCENVCVFDVAKMRPGHSRAAQKRPQEGLIAIKPD